MASDESKRELVERTFDRCGHTVTVRQGMHGDDLCPRCLKSVWNHWAPVLGFRRSDSWPFWAAMQAKKFRDMLAEVEGDKARLRGTS